MAFVFFDDYIAEERKQRMVKNLAKSDNCSHAVKANMKIEEIEASEVEDFVSVKSLQFFKAFNMLKDLLSLPQAVWMSNNGRIEGKKKAKQLRVINNASEREEWS